MCGDGERILELLLPEIGKSFTYFHFLTPPGWWCLLSYKTICPASLRGTPNNGGVWLYAGRIFFRKTGNGINFICKTASPKESRCPPAAEEIFYSNDFAASKIKSNTSLGCDAKEAWLELK
jgi:hypothetical protein